MNYDEDIMLMVLDLGRDLISTDGDAGQMLRMLAAEAIADGHGSEAHERLVSDHTWYMSLSPAARGYARECAW